MPLRKARVMSVVISCAVLLVSSTVVALTGSVQAAPPTVVDVLIVGGRVLDGGGNPWVLEDVGIDGDTITFVGHATAEGIAGRETIDARGKMVSPGFWDVHSHAGLASTSGKHALPQLYQGITTVVLGIDGAGESNVAQVFANYRSGGIAVNVLRYVGHNAARQAVMGSAARAPAPDELERMKEFIKRGMDQGAIGMSTGLFYAPGYFARTDEVIELNRVAARYGAIYDTHDRDLGVAYKGIGYDASVREAIEIGERAGTKVMFSHFGPQGTSNYGRAGAGIALIEAARDRGVNVMAGQHPYDATSSNLEAYAIPRWAVEGGRAEMRRRFRHPQTRLQLAAEIDEMLNMRGGAARLVLTGQPAYVSGKSLARLAEEWRQSVPDTTMRLLTEHDSIGVINRLLYDPNNTKVLAQQEWMMTCTDGGTPEFGVGIVHPRSYGAFSKKLRDYVLDSQVLSLAFAIRGMTSLASDFFNIPDRGWIRVGQKADLLVFDIGNLRDHATFDAPHQYSTGMQFVLVNGQVAVRDGKATSLLAGRPIPRNGASRSQSPAARGLLAQARSITARH